MEEFDCLRAVGSFEHRKACFAQHLLYSDAKRRLIFHNKHRGIRRSVQLLPTRGVAGLASRSSLRRQQPPNTLSLPDLAFKPNYPVKTPDDSVDHRKSETAAGRLGPEKRIKDPGLDV